jgi:energy-coupling factor transporter ATP-binding protein EcfA2
VLVDGFGTRDEASVHEIRRRVGIVFQDPDEQLVETTVEREIGIGLRNLGLEPSKVAVRVDRALAIFGIEHLRRRSCYLLSAGEKQLVAVASVFAMEPDYVLLDESTSLLDARARVGLVEAVERLIAETGAGLVFISMRLEDVWMCDRVAFLREGAVAFTSGKEDLAVRIAGLGLSLPGLAYMMNRLQGVVPDLGKRLAAGRSVSADSIYGALARLASGTGGGADCP